MIGNLISMHFLGKKSWKLSFIFWAVTFVIGIFLSYAIAIVSIPYLSMAIGALIVLVAAHYWYNLNWVLSIEVFAVGFVVNIIIMMILIAVLGASIGVIFGL
jgi:small basic protein